MVGMDMVMVMAMAMAIMMENSCRIYEAYD